MAKQKKPSTKQKKSSTKQKKAFHKPILNSNRNNDNETTYNNNENKNNKNNYRNNNNETTKNKNTKNSYRNNLNDTKNNYRNNLNDTKNNKNTKNSYRNNLNDTKNNKNTKNSYRNNLNDNKIYKKKTQQFDFKVNSIKTFIYSIGVGLILQLFFNQKLIHIFINNDNIKHLSGELPLDSDDLVSGMFDGIGVINTAKKKQIMDDLKTEIKALLDIKKNVIEPSFFDIKLSFGLNHITLYMKNKINLFHVTLIEDTEPLELIFKLSNIENNSDESMDVFNTYINDLTDQLINKNEDINELIITKINEIISNVIIKNIETDEEQPQLIADLQAQLAIYMTVEDDEDGEDGNYKLDLGALISGENILNNGTGEAFLGNLIKLRNNNNKIYSKFQNTSVPVNILKIIKIIKISLTSLLSVFVLLKLFAEPYIGNNILYKIVKGLFNLILILCFAIISLFFIIFNSTELVNNIITHSMGGNTNINEPTTAKNNNALTNNNNALTNNNNALTKNNNALANNSDEFNTIIYKIGHFIKVSAAPILFIIGTVIYMLFNLYISGFIFILFGGCIVAASIIGKDSESISLIPKSLTYGILPILSGISLIISNYMLNKR
jgi:hypothetical protein